MRSLMKVMVVAVQVVCVLALFGIALYALLKSR